MADVLLAGLRAREVSPEAFIPYVRYATPSTLVLRSGAVMTMIALEGAAFETADTAALAALNARLGAVYQGIADERLAVWTHVIRRRSQAYATGAFTSQFARDLDAKYRARLVDQELFRNELYLTLVVTPAASDKFGAWIGQLAKVREAGTEVDPKSHKLLADKVSETVAGLASYGPRVLGLVADDGLVFSEVSAVLHRLVGGRAERVPLTAGPVWSAVYQDRMTAGWETIEHRHEDRSHTSAMLAFKEYPATTHHTMLDGVLSLPFECVLSQSFRFLAKQAGMTVMARKQNQMVSSGDRASSQIDELDAGLDGLQSGRFVMGEHQASLAVMGDTPSEVGDRLSMARVQLANGGAVVVREDWGLAATWLSQLPGNFEHRPRVAVINSANFAALAPLHGYPAGRATGNVWGDAVATLKTSSGGAYHFNFHVSDLGNTFICGPSGSGKTVALNFLLSQLQKHDPDIVFFDKDRGAELFVRAAGGTYLALRNGQPTGCAPLKGIAFTAANLVFLEHWVAKLAAPNRPLTAVERAEVRFALEAVGSLPVHQRTIAALRSFVNTTQAEGIASGLARWEQGGSLGWVFDNEHDAIGKAARFCGFDMTEFLDNAEVRTPLMAYLFHRIEERIDGRRIAIVIDEFWKVLGDEMFRDLAQNKLKTIRKQNGLMIFATQSPRDALISPIAHTIIEQCPTQIFFPNERGQGTDYIDGFKLTHREFDLVSRTLSSANRRFLIKQGHASVVAELDLTGFDDELAILSGRTAHIELLEHVLWELGAAATPEAWLPRFHELRRG